MLRIQVGHCYFLRYDRKQWERGKPYPPLATIQIAALLRELGHEVSLFDAMLADDASDYEAALHAQQPDLVVLYEDNFNYLTKMCLSRMREAACTMIGAASARGARVVVAGSDASDAPEAFLDAGADAVLAGEGIPALVELVARLDSERDISADRLTANLAGITARREQAVQVTHIGIRPPDPRLVGRAAWDLLDIDKYSAMWRERHGYFSLNMAAARGCPFRCNWCAKPIWGNHYRQRSARDFAAEMSYLKRTFAPEHIWMADDIFGMHIDWVTEFTSHLEAEDGSVPFTIQTRADLVSERMAAALAAAGCTEAWIGAESGSQRVLERMNKGTRVEELVEARERLRRHGIRVGFFIQLGYLGEQLPDLLATRALVERAAPDDIGVSVSYPLPGTKFYEQVKTQLGEKTHWRDSDDLSMMFRGAYDSQFYRQVRDLLHDQVALRQSRAALPPDASRAADEEIAARWDALVARADEHRVRSDVALAATPTPNRHAAAAADR